MVAYFDIGLLSSSFSTGEEGTIVKDALILVEGTHTDNAGKTHTFSKDRVMRNALNTNDAIAKGEIIPFKANHSKDVRDDMGEVVSNIECRTITENDLPDSRHKHLVGRLGAFSKIEIKKNLDDVSRKIIKSLSPGIDMTRDRLIEVSAVSRPAILGLGLFGASGSLSFAEAKEASEGFKKERDRLQNNFNVFLSVVQNILSLEDTDFEAQNKNALLQRAIEEMGDAIAVELGVNKNRTLLGNNTQVQDKPYDDNPYADTIVKPNPNNRDFSRKDDVVLFDKPEENARKLTFKKRRK